MVAYTNVKERRSARNILMINRKFFAILLMLTPLYLFTNPVLQALGYGSILFIFVLCIFDLFGRFNSIKVSRIWNWFFAYCAYSVLTLLREPTMGAIYSFLLQNILLLFMCMLSSINWSVDMIQCVKRAGKALCIVLFYRHSLLRLWGHALDLLCSIPTSARFYISLFSHAVTSL